MRVGALIPYRMGSSRLPGKPLLDVAGRIVLERAVGRAQACSQVVQVAVATTREPSDDCLVDVATSLGLEVYRGSTEDVLTRLASAASIFGFDVVVEVDGDDLLCAPEYMERGLAVLAESEADYVSFRGLPLGATPSVLRASALTRAARDKGAGSTSTGFFRFLRESGMFRLEQPEVTDPAHRLVGARMTLDYPQDLEFFRAVYGQLDRLPSWGWTDLIRLLREQPELTALNQGLDDIYAEHFVRGLRSGA